MKRPRVVHKRHHEMVLYIEWYPADFLCRSILRVWTRVREISALRAQLRSLQDIFQYTDTGDNMQDAEQLV